MPAAALVQDYYYLDAVQIGYHLRLGALSLLLYDYFLTLDDEVVLFWKRPWTIATYLFLWTRYGGMVQLIWTLSLVVRAPDQIAACRAWFMVEMCLGGINTWVIQAILFLRLYALYSCSRRIALYAASLFVVQMLGVTGISAFALPIISSSLRAVVVGGISYCEINNLQRVSMTWLYWLFFALFEAFILFFTIRKGNSCCRHQGTFRLTNLVSTLYWDSIYYCILIETFYVLNIILDLINHKNYDILSGPGFSFPVIMGGRMMINVRKTIHEDRLRQNPSTPSQICVDGMDSTDESPSPAWTVTYI